MVQRNGMGIVAESGAGSSRIIAAIVSAALGRSNGFLPVTSSNLYDVSADYALTPRVSVTLYWGYAMGHAVIASIYPLNKHGSLGFIEFNIKL